MKTEHKAPEMSGIFKELAENFISFKRNLGFKYQSEEKVMSRFCRFSELPRGKLPFCPLKAQGHALDGRHAPDEVSAFAAFFRYGLSR